MAGWNFDEAWSIYVLQLRYQVVNMLVVSLLEGTIVNRIFARMSLWLLKGEMGET